MKVREFLIKNNVLNQEIGNVDFHMNLLNIDLDELKRRIPKLKEKNEQELLDYIIQIYKKCDSSNPEYDTNLDEQMVKIGLRLFDTIPGPYNRNKWNTGLFEDDGFGFGTEPTSLYDDYIDKTNDLENNFYSKR